MHMNPSTVVLIQKLAAAVPALEEEYENHFSNFAEVLPTVFMEDVRQSAVASFLGAADEPDWRSILAFLEEQFALGDKDVQNVIFMSFIYPLPFPHEPGSGIADHLGPTMAESFRSLRGAQ